VLSLRLLLCLCVSSSAHIVCMCFCADLCLVPRPQTRRKKRTITTIEPQCNGNQRNGNLPWIRLSVLGVYIYHYGVFIVSCVQFPSISRSVESNPRHTENYIFALGIYPQICHVLEYLLYYKELSTKICLVFVWCVLISYSNLTTWWITIWNNIHHFIPTLNT